MLTSLQQDPCKHTRPLRWPLMLGRMTCKFYLSVALARLGNVLKITRSVSSWDLLGC